MYEINCPVCSTSVAFNIKRQPIDIPGVLKEYIQCPKCPYTKNISYTTLKIIDLQERKNQIGAVILSSEMDEIEVHSTIFEKYQELTAKLNVAKKELAEILNEQP